LFCESLDATASVKPGLSVRPTLRLKFVRLLFSAILLLSLRPECRFSAVPVPEETDWILLWPNSPRLRLYLRQKDEEGDIGDEGSAEALVAPVPVVAVLMNVDAESRWYDVVLTVAPLVDSEADLGRFLSFLGVPVTPLFDPPTTTCDDTPYENADGATGDVFFELSVVSPCPRPSPVSPFKSMKLAS
jgi:hypothetical protein